MAELRDILYNVRITSTIGDMNAEIAGVAFDSRKIKPGFLFVASKGTQVDGHKFIDKAIAGGAIAIVCDVLPESINESVSYITVKNSAHSLGIICGNFYGNPSKKLKLVGVTGTNGKTTVATLLYKLFGSLGHRCGLLSTVENRIIDRTITATHTTPDPIQINELMVEMLSSGCTHCFMEVSSHAVDQGRIEGLHFAGALFTNITHDHLDYHRTLKAISALRKGSLMVCRRTPLHW